MSRRGSGEGTIYKEGLYWVVEVQWTDAEGTHRKRRKRTTRTEAVAARDGLVRDVKEGRVPTRAVAEVTVADAMTRYLEEAALRVRPRTLRDYTRYVHDVIVPAMGRKRAHAVRRSDVTRMLAGVNGARVKQLAYVLAKAAIGPYVRVVDPIEHPFPPRSTPKTVRKVVPGFDHAVIGRIFDAVRGGPLELYVLLDNASGLRQSEVLGLTWGDVRSNHLIVHQRLDEYTKTLGPTKTDASRRRNDLPSAAIAALALHKTRAELSGYDTRDCDFVFRGKTGKPMNAANLRRSWRRIRERHGLPPFRLYDLRHAHASLLAEAGIPSKVIAERLGHSSTRLTDDTYSHLMPGMQREATDIVGKLLDDEFRQ